MGHRSISMTLRYTQLYEATKSYNRVIYFGRTAWTDAPHFPCRDPVSCPYGHGNLPRPGSDSTLFGIRHHDRMRHMFIAGMSGMGKTSLLANMSLADIAAGHGVACIDPHGDWASSLLDAIPPSRTRSTIYFDPADVGRGGWNHLRTDCGLDHDGRDG
jgi:hypothetical protein